MAETEAGYLAIFDCDFIPPVDYLKKMIPFFLERGELGIVQARWAHVNEEASVLTRAQSIGIDGHFMVEQCARAFNGLFMNFNGTAGVWRREAIEEAGGWSADTLTEDIDLSYRAQLAGWKAHYVPEVGVPAEIPEDVAAFKGQQFRWAKGSIQTAIKILPRVLESGASPLAKTVAFFHLTHYVIHPLMLLLGLLALPMLLFVKLNVAGIWLVVLGLVIALTLGGAELGVRGEPAGAAPGLAAPDDLPAGGDLRGGGDGAFEFEGRVRGALWDTERIHPDAEKGGWGKGFLPGGEPWGLRLGSGVRGRTAWRGWWRTVRWGSG